MQTDILASVPLTATGDFTAQSTGVIDATRVRALYIIPTAVAGSVVLRDKSSGATVATINTVASATETVMLWLPGEGLRFRVGVHGTLANVASVVIFYG